MQANTDNSRLHWLLNTVHAVEDLLEERIEERNGNGPGQAPQTSDPALQELRISLEELRVVGEELKRQSDLLLVERQRYADLFNYAPDAYVVTDMDATVRDSNLAAVQLLGCPAESLAGKPLMLFIEPNSRALTRRNLTFMAAGLGQGPREWQVDLMPRAGGPVRGTVLVSIVPQGKGRPNDLCWLIRATPA